MEAYQDFKELLELFNARQVDYLIVGAHALAFYGAPRYTGDMDLLIHSDPKNADRITKALADFGFASVNLKPEDFIGLDKVIQLGVAPVRVDILTSLTGVSWEEAFRNRTIGKYGDVNVYYIGKPELIRNKRATGRKKDLADLEALDEE